MLDPLNEAELIGWIGEAFEVFKRLPDPERKFLRARNGSWPAHVCEAVEGAYVQTPLRMPPPTPAAIDRAVQLVEWMATHLRNYPVGTRLLWLTYGRGLSLGQCSVALRRMRGRGNSKTALHNKRRAALSALLHGINLERSRMKKCA